MSGTSSDAPARAYDDAAPALAELKALGVRLIAASMLSREALTRFLDSTHLARFFDEVRSAGFLGAAAGWLADFAGAARVIRPKYK